VMPNSTGNATCSAQAGAAGHCSSRTPGGTPIPYTGGICQ
jgi:hypothetical protein